MTNTYGYVVCAQIPAPRTQHGWIYEPLSAVSFDLGRVRNCFESCLDRVRKGLSPRHPEARDYVLCELVPVSLEKPAWPVRDQLDRPVVRVRNERLPYVVNLDEAVGA